MNDYYVVALTHDNPLAQNNKFHDEGVRLLKESIKRIPKGISNEEAERLKYAVVYTLILISPEVREKFRDIDDNEISVDPWQLSVGSSEPAADFDRRDSDCTRSRFDGTFAKEMIEYMRYPPSEYEKYQGVYFLNDVALNMYREGGIELDIMKTIPKSELPKGCNRSLEGPYIPR
jgi:hypothetical protein